MQHQKIHIKKNDIVLVTKGREKGKSGKVLRINPEKGTALVERTNFVKRHSRPSQKLRQGGIVEKEAPLPLPNLMVMCAKCNKPVRIRKKILEDGGKVRVCHRCGDVLDK
jgi:large subunit ribosomal protein L24